MLQRVTFSWKHCDALKYFVMHVVLPEKPPREIRTFPNATRKSPPGPPHPHPPPSRPISAALIRASRDVRRCGESDYSALARSAPRHAVAVITSSRFHDGVTEPSSAPERSGDLRPGPLLAPPIDLELAGPLSRRRRRRSPSHGRQGFLLPMVMLLSESAVGCVVLLVWDTCYAVTLLWSK